MPLTKILGTALVLFISFATIANCEYYSSVDNLQILGDIELQLLDTTREYLVEQRQQLITYRNFIQRVKREHEQAVLDLDAYVGHPLRAFQLLKRMVYDWSELHGLISENRLASVINDKLTELTEKYGYPDQKELRGAINGLARLQEVYDLKAVDITDGILNGYNTDSQLDWKECYEIGALLFMEQKYKLAVEWLQIAITLLMTDDVTSEDQAYIVEIHEYLALAEFELGNASNAKELIGKTTALNSTYSAQFTRVYLDQSVAPEPSEPSQADWYQNYTRLCQGHRVPEPKHSQLRCFLDSRRHTVFTLAPLKVEEVHQDPDIYVYHGLLSNEKISAIFEEIDKTEMFRSVVGSHNPVIHEMRVSQQTWLDYSSPIMRRVRNLVEDISGLDLTVAVERMQVANYGVGGQYDPHHDYFIDIPSDFKGNRYSTSMFYLSNVERGGFTVFPQLNVFLPPIKGAMVMWYNLHRSLEPDTRTLHAGCPVIVGSKRIANIWVQSGHQELRRPCALHLDMS